MFTEFTAVIILAQAGAAKGTDKPAQSPLMMWMFPLFMILLLFMWLQTRSQQKKQRQQREEMIASLRPKDKIETIGGIFGTVVNVRDDDLTIRVDESKDITMKIAKSAVRRKVNGQQNPEK